MGERRYRVTYSPKARADLREIVRFIAADKPVAAEQFALKLIDLAESLGDQPRSGRVVPEFRRPELREKIFRRYRIVYRVEDERELIVVARFWHAARGQPEI